MADKTRVGRPAESDEPKLGCRISKAAADRLEQLQDSVEGAERQRPNQGVLISALILEMDKRGETLWRDVIKKYGDDV
jgi:hypothetical protein